MWSLGAFELRSVITAFAIITQKMFGERFYSYKCHFREMSVIYSGRISDVLLAECSKDSVLNELMEQFGQTLK